MSITRFSAKRDGPYAAKVKDNKTGKIIAYMPEDPDHPEMAGKYAEAAAQIFNEKHEQHLKKRKKMGFKK